jgi:osmotically-inducible protein OsmY
MTTALNRSADPQAQDLEYRVRLFLQQRRVTQGARLRLEADRGVVILRGHVASFHQRQLIHTLARHVAGVVQVIDELQVVPPSAPSVRREPRTQPLAITA